MADILDVTKEIVLQMIEHGSIHRAPIGNHVEKNEKNVEEICKAFKEVYKTVNNCLKGELD